MVWMIFEYELNDFHKYVYFALLWSDEERNIMNFLDMWCISMFPLWAGKYLRALFWCIHYKRQGCVWVCVIVNTLCVLNTLMWAFYTLAIKMRRISNWILIDSLESSFHKRLVVLVIVRSGIDRSIDWIMERVSFASVIAHRYPSTVQQPPKHVNHKVQIALQSKLLFQQHMETKREYCTLKLYTICTRDN